MDCDYIFGAAFGRHLYSTYQVSCLLVLAARHKWLMMNRPRLLSPINMALKILVNTPRASIPTLVKFRPMVFEIRMCSIYSAPYRLSSTCFGRQIPSTVVNLPTKFCDDRAKGVGIMANHF